MAYFRCFFRQVRFISTDSKESMIRLTHLEGRHIGVAVLGMCRRNGAKNAIDKKFSEQFSAILQSLKFNENLRTVILKSDIPKVFCVGADLKERYTMKPHQIEEASQRIKRIAHELKTFPVPVIAAIEGFALGGGLEIALGCDMRVAAKGAVLGLPETGHALIPGAGGTQNLPRLIGEAKAKEVIFCDQRFSGEEAERIGLVNYAVQQNEEGEAAYEKALQMASKILTKGPVAIRMAKKAINTGLSVDINTGLAVETACYAQIIPTDDRIEGLEAFIGKREPEYKGK